jgi:hypothetical protein
MIIIAISAEPQIDIAKPAKEKERRENLKLHINVTK